VLAATLAAAGAFLMIAANDPSTPPGGLKQSLKAIASSTVLFGHQSVGFNVLDGLRGLAREEGIELRIAQVNGVAELRPDTFGHVTVPSNGDPLRKLASFTTALVGGEPDVAFVKFCYVDFDVNTDTRAVFAAYEATLRELKAKHPRTTFVHVTVPLVAGDGYLKSLVKNLLGRASPAVPSNERREEYNALLRSTFANEPIYDLARVESTDSSGRPVSATLNGKAVPMLASEYTTDGGHLNAAGARRAALALVTVLGDSLSARATRVGDGRVGAR